MNAMAITSRELRERTRLFVVAAALAVIPFIVAAMPGTRENRSLTIALLAASLGLIYASSVALALGASTITGDLVERRLSFYFTKPVSPAALWVGKLLGAMIACAVSFAIITIPAFIAAPAEFRSKSDAVGLTAIFALVLFLASHASATMVRSRSILVAVDFVCLAAAIGAVYFIFRPLFLGAALDAMRWLAAFVAAGILMLLAVAPVWQLARGRTDIKRSHAALSMVLWAGVGAILAIAAAVTVWIVTAPPDSLRQNYSEVEQTPSGDRVFLSGTARERGGYQTSFLLDTRTGESKRVAASVWAPVAMSRSGNVIAWFEHDDISPRASSLRVRFETLSEAGPAHLTDTMRSGFAARLVLSPDGSRVAVVEGARVVVSATADGRMLASAKLSGTRVGAVYFVTNDLVRVVERGPGSSRFYELDVPRRTMHVATLGVLEGVISVSEDGSRMLVRNSGRIVDGRTGATIAQLPKTRRAVMLGDGTVVDIDAKSVRVFNREGVVTKTLPIGWTDASVTAQVGGTSVLVHSAAGMHVVDLATGRVTATAAGVKGPMGWDIDPRLKHYAANATLAGVDRDARLVLWDAQTGSVRKAF